MISSRATGVPEKGSSREQTHISTARTQTHKGERLKFRLTLLLLLLSSPSLEGRQAHSAGELMLSGDSCNLGNYCLPAYSCGYGILLHRRSQHGAVMLCMVDQLLRSTAEVAVFQH